MNHGATIFAFWDPFPPEKGYKSGLYRRHGVPLFSDFPRPVREVRRFPRARARGNAPHGRRAALRPIALHPALLTSLLTGPNHNLTGRGTWAAESVEEGTSDA